MLLKKVSTLILMGIAADIEVSEATTEGGIMGTMRIAVMAADMMNMAKGMKGTMAGVVVSIEVEEVEEVKKEAVTLVDEEAHVFNRL